MSSTYFVMKTVTGETVKFKRTVQQGRRKSLDPKERVPIRLHRSWIAAIEASGKTTQEFIEDAVRNAIFVSQELLNS